MKSRLHVLNARTGRVKAEVKTPGKLGAFKISPDSQTVRLKAC